MIFQYISRILTFSFLAVIGGSAQAQQIHFVYLQTENAQPFYIKLNNVVTSSSSLGYLIIPKLSDGDYDITVGFPKKEFPEEKFQLSVDKKNEGFLLKNFGDRGWGLFNLQSFSVVMGAGEADAKEETKNIQSDPFSNMLATVVKDSSILEKPKQVVESVPKKPDSIATLNEADTSKMIAQPGQPVLLSTVRRTLFAKNQDGVEMIYIDKLDDMNSDTVRIFMPVSISNKIADASSNSASAEETKSDTVAKAVLKEPSLPAVEPVINVTSDNEPDSAKEVMNQKEPKQTSENSTIPEKNVSDQPVAEPVNPNGGNDDKVIKEENSKDDGFPKVIAFSKTNSDCKAFASNEDFIKLRKKMAGENNDDNMLREAKKGFRYKCYSTEQIKNLSFLFLTEEGKYRFFDAAYAFTSDSDQYYKLQGQLSDPYYINRFKAMIHK
ncbi:MAG: hypothetical protein M3015_12465 [Bacteroidota bacterium]|nr:hypothetical protein [Bacteroidota bacterium]